jgi:hypothetical protein
MPRRGGAPSRRPSAREKRLSLRVFTEGEKTEPIYVTYWHRLHRERVVVSISEFHGTPRSLVEAAVAEQKEHARAARRRGGDPFDQYWCVFDVDAHPRLAEALDLATRHNIEIAYSNPCIELWFVLHFRDQNAYIDRHAVQRLSRDLLGCEKLLTAEALATLERLHEDAVTRARALDEKHLGDDSPPGSNPSSTLWRLIDVIRNA